MLVYPGLGALTSRPFDFPSRCHSPIFSTVPTHKSGKVSIPQAGWYIYLSSLLYLISFPSLSSIHCPNPICLHTIQSLHIVSYCNPISTPYIYTAQYTINMGSMAEPTRKPWARTPCVKSVALSREAGWYFPRSLFFLYTTNNPQQHLPQTRKPPTFRFLQVPRNRQSSLHNHRLSRSLQANSFLLLFWGQCWPSLRYSCEPPP